MKLLKRLMLPEDRKELLIATADGSLTIRDSATGELYHNKAGAYKEALLNYVEPSGALAKLAKQSRLGVLDVCFGLGYNSFVLVQEALKNEIAGEIDIHAIEIDPLVLNYLPLIMETPAFSLLSKIIDVEQLSQKKAFSVAYKGLKINILIELNSVRASIPGHSDMKDLIFHDPFSPRKVPELWTLEIFQHYFRILKERKGAILTYSAAYAVRGGLQQAGFTVMKTVAVGEKSGGGSIGFVDKNSADNCFKAFALSKDEIEGISGPKGLPYRDPELSCLRRRVILARQEQLSRLRRD